MKQMYIITVWMGSEDSVFFGHLTESEASALRAKIRSAGHKVSVKAIRKSPGFHSFRALMKNF